jgi:beta-galactosidase
MNVAKISRVALFAAAILTFRVSFHAAGLEETASYDFLENGVKEAKVVVRNGVPQILINGQAVPPLFFFFNLEILPDRLALLSPQVGDAAASGIHLYSTTFDSWPWEGSPPDYTAADLQMDRFLKADPKAVFLLRVNVSPPQDWVGWRDRDRLRRTEDNTYADGSTEVVSAASDFYFQASLASLRKMIQHYETSPYASHILGYHVAGQGGEWFPPSYWEKGPDYSPVNLQAFRAWLKNKYGEDASLVAAWGRKSVTLSNAPIPVPKPGRFPIQESAPGARIEAFYRLPAEQDWVDYSLYISDLISQRLLDIAHVIRAETHGKRLIAFFYGYIFELDGSMNGHLRMDRLLRSPDIDILAAPFSYQDRQPGGAGGAMTALDSVAAHGKLWMNEDDLRTHLDKTGEPDVPRTKSFAETFNVLERNMASNLVHRAGTWWMDLKAAGSFNDPALWRVMSDFGLPLYRELYTDPRPFHPAVAVIVDQDSVAFQKSDRALTSERKALRDMMAKTGASVGYYYLDDFLDGTVPPCRAYFFVNEFSLDDLEIAKIRARLEAEGATAIWQYAPAYQGPSGRDVSRARALTGIKLKVSKSNGGATNDGLSILAGEHWGWPERGTLSPRLVVADSNVVILGRYRSDRQVSAASKRVGSAQSVFLGGIGLNPNVLRILLKQAGVHIWSDSGDVIQTDGNILAIHSSSSGSRTIHLPAGTAIAALSGEVLARSPNPFILSFAATGETQWFRVLAHP